MFDALDYDSQRHFLAVASEKRRAQVLAADNVQAVYVDDMNTGYGSRSGAARADALVSTRGWATSTARRERTASKPSGRTPPKRYRSPGLRQPCDVSH